MAWSLLSWQFHLSLGTSLWHIITEGSEVLPGGRWGEHKGCLQSHQMPLWQGGSGDLLTSSWSQNLLAAAHLREEQQGWVGSRSEEWLWEQGEPGETSGAGKAEGSGVGKWGGLDPCWRSEELRRWEGAKNIGLPRTENQADDGGGYGEVDLSFLKGIFFYQLSLLLLGLLGGCEPQTKENKGQKPKSRKPKGKKETIWVHVNGSLRVEFEGVVGCLTTASCFVLA